MLEEVPHIRSNGKRERDGAWVEGGQGGLVAEVLHEETRE